MNKIELYVRDQIEVKTERLAYGGEAIARYQGLTIFVQGGAPDETLRVRIIERKKNYARAMIEEILIPSPVRREPPCKYFGTCGGCQLQHINYETQLAAKVGFIRDALKRTGQIDWTDEIKIHSSKEFNYRLRAKIKLEPVFSDEKKSVGQKPKKIHIGFYQARSHNVCDIDYCEILLPELNVALQTIRTEYNRLDGWTDNPVKEIEIAALESFNDEFNAQDNDPDAPDSLSLIPPFFNITQRYIAGTFYQFTPSTFFQANALLLDEFVKEAVGTEKGDFALDLYAGVGLFTIQLANNFKRVIGIETHPHSIKIGNANIFHNKIENAEIVCNRTDTWLKNYLSQSPVQTPDLILLDPPRSGAAEALGFIIKLNPKRIHYVSCDPVTLARDLKMLVAENYEIERIVAFDMFPQTYHIESMAFLKKR